MRIECAWGVYGVEPVREGIVVSEYSRSIFRISENHGADPRFIRTRSSHGAFFALMARSGAERCVLIGTSHGEADTAPLRLAPRKRMF